MSNILIGLSAFAFAVFLIWFATLPPRHRKRRHCEICGSAKHAEDACPWATYEDRSE